MKPPSLASAFLRAVLFAGLLGGLAGCVTGPTPAERATEQSRLSALAAYPAVAVSAEADPFRDADSAFRLGALGDPRATERIRALPESASPEIVAAAAMGLSKCKADGAEAALLALALRPSHPPEALEALFNFYRARTGPPPVLLPDQRLLLYAHLPSARARAAFGHLARAVKDPALIPVLDGLGRDPDFEVRRAAALALGDGPPKYARPAADRAQCLAILERMLHDVSTHVVIASARAIASYDDPSGIPLLTALLDHADFNVRVAAVEGLVRRKAVVAEDRLGLLVQRDPSNSVRYSAATGLETLNLAEAKMLVPVLLASPSEYVRSAAAEILGKSPAEPDLKQLAQLAVTDPHVRVRETAVGAFEGQKGAPIAKAAVVLALKDRDPGVAEAACEVVGKNGWTDLVRELIDGQQRFLGAAGASVRVAVLDSLSLLDGVSYRALFSQALQDPNPSVRDSAAAALAKLDQGPTPAKSRGADLSGDLLPGGAPLFEKDVFLVIETDQGTMKVRLDPELAPVDCAHVAALARQGFYDGLTWHRVVPDFVIQGGCPRGDGSGGAGVTLPIEPTRLAFERGTLGMPRDSNPDSGGCQLFICSCRLPNLDVDYTAFGQVVEGLDVIDRIDVDSHIRRIRVEGMR